MSDSYDPIDCSTPGSSVLHYLLEFAQIHVHWVGDTVQPSHPLLPLLLLPSVFPSIIAFQMSQLFAAGGESIGVSASTSVLPINTQGWFTLGLITFRTDWFDILAVQGTLKSLLQHHTLKASILRHSAFFMVQLSHSYMTTGKTIALTVWTHSLCILIPEDARGFSHLLDGK